MLLLNGDKPVLEASDDNHQDAETVDESYGVAKVDGAEKHEQYLRGSKEKEMYVFSGGGGAASVGSQHQQQGACQRISRTKLYLLDVGRNAQSEG